MMAKPTNKEEALARVQALSGQTLLHYKLGCGPKFHRVISELEDAWMWSCYFSKPDLNYCTDFREGQQTDGPSAP